MKQHGDRQLRQHPRKEVRIRKAALIATALASVLLSCGGGGERPNFLLITLDTMRADHLGCYGYFRDTSPHIDSLAAESLVFDGCLAPIATTLPSHLSLFTASYPMEHGVLANTGSARRRFVSNRALRSFAETAREAGYRTAAFISATPLKRHTGIDAGFELFDEPPGAERRAEETSNAALAWLEDADDRPWFAWVHYFDPHVTYAPPAPWDERYQVEDGLLRHLGERQFIRGTVRHAGEEIRTADLVNLYDGEVAYMDGQIGRLIAALRSSGDYDRTVIVLVGDHGESLGQHDVWHHGGVWGEQLRVPLLMRIPGTWGDRSDRPISVADVLPTLFALEGGLPRGAIPDQGGGLDAFHRADPFLPGQSSTRTSAERGRPELFSLTTPRWKLIHHPGGEDRLYDLDADPHELFDLAPSLPETTAALRTALAKTFSEQRENRIRLLDESEGAEPDTASLDPAVREELRSLGYVD